MLLPYMMSTGERVAQQKIGGYANRSWARGRTEKTGPRQNAPRRGRRKEAQKERERKGLLDLAVLYMFPLYFYIILIHLQCQN